MKKIISLALCLVFQYSFSQNLTLNEVLSLKTMSITQAEEFLTSKNWNYIGIKKKTSGEFEFDSFRFSYNQNIYTGNAESFIGLLNIAGINLINFQVNNKYKHQEYLNKIKSYGCKLVDSGIEDGNIYKVYQGKTTTFFIDIISNQKGSGSAITSYNYDIVPNEFYEAYSR